VKSIGGIRVSSAFVREKGLVDDRRWMLVDNNKIFMTQRDHPRLSLFKTERTGHSFCIRYGQDVLDLPAPSNLNGEPETVRVWDDMVSVKFADASVNKWFSDRLAFPCNLVWFPEENFRPVDPDYAVGKENVSLADGYPLLVIGQASLDDLNTRLTEPVPINRFRPNLVFTGGKPYEEDHWKSFRVGNNRFLGVKTCGRCVTTTVNQETGEKGREPLLTLSRYRREGEKISFGQNVLAVDHNEIREGDEISFE